VYLTMDPRHIDILCVNCYECLTLEEVDIHSMECSKKPDAVAQQETEQ